MELVAYRVTNFRSVIDSDWIEVKSVTALIGENESGKTNLLLPLWKFNPATAAPGSSIDPQPDMPQAAFAELRHRPAATEFVRARFQLTAAEAKELASLTQCPADEVDLVEVGRRYDESYQCLIPKIADVKLVLTRPYVDVLSGLVSQLDSTDEALKPGREILAAQALSLKQTPLLREGELKVLAQKVREKLPTGHQAVSALDAALSAALTEAKPSHEQGAVIDWIKTSMPRFIYYSNYGALDSRINLPRVIERMGRPPSELDRRDEAQTRTLDVLFKYVKLTPQEILELGTELPTPQGPVDENQRREIEKQLARKETRQELLLSAGTRLSSGFRDWWKRGSYNFRFVADGNYFNIIVSDSRRPAEISLDRRSQGLQWFFAFFIVFLVEQQGAHKNAILLLDEPGVTLHPLAQEDLFKFFENLSSTNQILYTAHSPFLVDPNHLSQVRVVFIDAKGNTNASSDLRKSLLDESRSKAIYAVDAALGLSISQTLMRYAYIAIVEGRSDQIYLSIMKRILIAGGHITPSRELLFVSAGGASGMLTTARILAVNGPPPVLLDADTQGVQAKTKLEGDLYADQQNRILMTSDFSSAPAAEIEDLLPAAWIVNAVDRVYRPANDDRFADVHDRSRPIVPQIKDYCAAHGIELVTPGWKVDLAAEVERRTLSMSAEDVPEGVLSAWERLFENILARQP